MTRLALILALASCAPVYSAVTKRCPTTTMLLGDFTVTAAALATSVLAYNAGHLARAGIAAGVGMTIAIGANLAETTCAL